LPTRNIPRTRWIGAIAALTFAVATIAAAPGSAEAASAATPDGHTLPTGTRFFVPPPGSAAVSQIFKLATTGDLKDAALVTKMEATPKSVWFTGGTPAQVETQVRETMFEAALERTVPVLVAYDIPGRDCAQYSAGGALDESDYDSWISAFAAGIGNGNAVVILEPDALGNLPSACAGFGTSTYPFTDSDRIAEINSGVNALEAQPNTDVYLDATNPAWQAVGTITQRLLEAGVQQAQGFYVNVSNYQSNAASTDYGTWISDCIAMTSDPSDWAYGKYGDCASQYYPATESNFSTWALTTAWYAENMGGAVASTDFVIDTSRNGQGSNTMQSYAAAPYNQSAATVKTLSAGGWCNQPDAGLGLRPTADTGVPLLAAYLWVKTPGLSDGQCDAAGGVRAWDYTAYTQPNWPTDATDQNLFDPLWGLTDPAAGSWFPQQALQLAQDANPPLS